MSQPQPTASGTTGLVESVGHIGHVAFPFVATDRAASAAMVLWSVIGAVVLVDLVWGAAVGLSVGGWWLPVLAAAMLLFVAWLYQHRSPILSDTAHTASLWICFTAAGCVLTYLGATCALPLQDAALTRVDQSFGFDWLAWRDAVETWPKLKFLLELAYGSLIPQFLLSSLLLPALGRTKRSVEPILLAAMTLLPTTAVSALWPALGPFAALGGERVEYLPQVVMLRAPGPWHFDIPTMQGILTMP